MSESSTDARHNLYIRGLRCWKCGGIQLSVIYTRRARGSKLVRRRECLDCQTRITTWEQAIGSPNRSDLKGSVVESLH